ncbi:MAG TPA: arginase family protein [Streptosporangiaceae bacterium]|nr:arginase family protein [Streptosporangiaceae bacterium]
MLLLPWHLTDHLAGGFNITLPTDVVVIHGRLGATGQPWTDLAGVYSGLRDAVAAAATPPVVVSGDCVASLAVIAGLHRRGVRAGMVWFDAHGDFHTEATTTSGYLGGLPLAKAVGRGDPSLPAALGMTPLPEESVMLVDGRDLDPPEVTALATSRLLRGNVTELGTSALPEGPLIVHVDLDVLDPAAVAGLRFPAPAGPSLHAVAAGIADVARRREIAALDIAATWRPAETDRAQTDAAVHAVLTAAGMRG